jgi:3-methyladenine DNA glycosylase AlkD
MHQPTADTMHFSDILHHMSLDKILISLKSLSNPDNVVGMARFGINPDKTLGISIPNLRKLAKESGKNHQLAQQLWETGIHEARILASMIDDPKKVTAQQMNNWAMDFDSWDVCDQVCMNLFAKSLLAYDKAIEWSSHKDEFVKRAGFAIMACLAWSNKEVSDEQLSTFFPIIKQESCDQRNFVKKSVNWALRQIGKRNANLRQLAIRTSEEIQKLDSKSAKWIAADALKELNSEVIKQKQTE